MKSFFAGLAITLLLSLASLSVDAQTIDSNANASTQSTASSQQQAQNANEQNINFNTPEHQTIRSAPALGGSSYGTSFSSDSCMNAAGGGLSLIGGAATFGGPKADEVCRRIRLSYAWGQYAKYLNDTHRLDTEAKVAGMIAYELCNAMPDDLKRCLELGLVKKAEGK